MSSQFETGLFTLLGVIIGSMLTMISMFFNSAYQNWHKERQLTYRTLKKASAYLSILVSIFSHVLSKDLDSDFNPGSFISTVPIDQFKELKINLTQFEGVFRNLIL